jgi:hypothetical protein
LNKSLLQIIEASTKSDKKKAPYDKFIEFNREEGDLLVERKKKDGSSFSSESIDEDDAKKILSAIRSEIEDIVSTCSAGEYTVSQEILINLKANLIGTVDENKSETLSILYKAMTNSELPEDVMVRLSMEAKSLPQSILNEQDWNSWKKFLTAISDLFRFKVDFD